MGKKRRIYHVVCQAEVYEEGKGVDLQTFQMNGYKIKPDKNGQAFVPKTLSLHDSLWVLQTGAMAIIRKLEAKDAEAKGVYMKQAMDLFQEMYVDISMSEGRDKSAGYPDENESNW